MCPTRQVIFQYGHVLIFPAVYIDGLAQERRNSNSIANALELRPSYTNSLIQYKLCIFIVIKFSISVPRVLPTLVMLFTSSGSRFALKAGRVKRLSYLVAIIVCLIYIFVRCNFWVQNIGGHAENLIMTIQYIATITLTSWSPRWRLTSPASRLFTQPFIQTQIKKNIKARRHWPLCGEFTGSGEFPAQRASNAENVSIWWRYHGSKQSWASCTIDVHIYLQNWETYLYSFKHNDITILSLLSVQVQSRRLYSQSMKKDKKYSNVSLYVAKHCHMYIFIFKRAAHQ